MLPGRPLHSKKSQYRIKSFSSLQVLLYFFPVIANCFDGFPYLFAAGTGFFYQVINFIVLVCCYAIAISLVADIFVVCHMFIFYEIVEKNMPLLLLEKNTQTTCCI